MRWHELPTPCYLVDESLLRRNLAVLKEVSDSTGCRILLAQKAFSMFEAYPVIGQYLAGTTASGLYEAKLGREEMGKETHIYSPAYRPEEFEEIAGLCDHIIFNSFDQLRSYGPVAKKAGKSVGLRINPECSTQAGHQIYDPCGEGSRLGITKTNFSLHVQPDLMAMVDGLHFHTLCEQNADALLTTVQAVEQAFGPWLPQMKWLNLGGGHHITRPDYDIPALKRCILDLKNQYGTELYLEPGEAVAYHAGFLITRVLDVMHNGMDIAILDTSAACHMPDVLEMPYRPPLRDSGLPGEKLHSYRLAGPTCLAGDIIGDYSFDRPLASGDLLIFEDMAIYSMVKNNTFNGIGLPSIAWRGQDEECRLIRSFGYDDFKMRLS